MNSLRSFRWLAVAGIVLAGGLMRLPLERDFTQEMRARGLAEEPLNLSLRDELGQNFFIAVLGGFRSLVASMVELESIDSWQEQNWEKVDAAYALANKLQPREYHYWNFRSWMSAYNAFEYYAWKDESRGALRPWLLQEYMDKGIDILKEGVRWLPNDYRLYAEIGRLYGDRRNPKADPASAAQWYEKAWKIAPGRGWLRRNYVFQLARVPGREVEAWRLLLELYNSPNQINRTPTGDTLLVLLFPKAKQQDPSLTLPPELAAKQGEILRRYEEFQRRANGPLPRVESPGIKHP